MEVKYKQSEFWESNFGKDYTDRNSRNDKDWDEFYLKNWGITKIEMNKQFIDNLSRDVKILEVGCNSGMQLAGLQRMGFKNLFGIELQPYAVEKAKEYTKNINIINASGFDIPFKDNYFDIVCTNVVLIHIAPEQHSLIMDEIYRCSKKYIWGFEYFENEITEINYRGHSDYLWKADYADIFLKRYKKLRQVKKELYPYTSPDEVGNQDCMYLLEKSDVN